MGLKEKLIVNSRPEETSWASALKSWGKALYSHGSLFIGLLVYTVIGGLVFRHLEYPSEVARLEELERLLRWTRSEFIISLENHTLTENPWMLTRYEEVIQKAARGGVLVPLNQEVNPASLARWSCFQAIFFASTVLTTIGYGNITPSTVEGRVFCILFALVGIPLTLSVLADLGSLLASTLPSMPEARGLTRSIASAAIATTILLIYIAVGSFLFISWEEEWSFFDGFYFCFVTMTTIGFGDLVPSTPQYMLLCTVYILLGLSLTSTIIELVRQQYSESWRHLQLLAETLSHLASERNNPADMQANLRKMITVINIPKGKKQKDWNLTVKKLTEEINNQKEKQKIFQIIIYETSV